MVADVLEEPEIAPVPTKRHPTRPKKPHTATLTAVKKLQVTYLDTVSGWGQIQRVGANVLNKHSRTANKGWSSREGLTTRRRKDYVTKC